MECRQSPATARKLPGPAAESRRQREDRRPKKDKGELKRTRSHIVRRAGARCCYTRLRARAGSEPGGSTSARLLPQFAMELQRWPSLNHQEREPPRSAHLSAYHFDRSCHLALASSNGDQPADHVGKAVGRAIRGRPDSSLRLGRTIRRRRICGRSAGAQGTPLTPGTLGQGGELTASRMKSGAWPLGIEDVKGAGVVMNRLATPSADAAA